MLCIVSMSVNNDKSLLNQIVELWRQYTGPLEIRIYRSTLLSRSDLEYELYKTIVLDPPICNPDAWVLGLENSSTNTSGQVTYFNDHDEVLTFSLTLPKGWYIVKAVLNIQQLIDFANTVPILQQYDQTYQPYFTPYFFSNWENALYYEQLYKQGLYINYPDMPNEVFIFPRTDIGREQGWEGLTLDDVPQVDDDQYHQTSKALEWRLFDFRVERTIEPEIVTIDVPVIPIQSFYDDLTFEWPTIPVEFSILCQT